MLTTIKKGSLYLTALIILVFINGQNAYAQDPHFSQFYNSPMTLNPGLTGLMNGDVRVVANYRTQWGTVATPFRTMAAAADMSVLQNTLQDDIMGLGLLIMSDRAGETNLTHNQIQLSFAYSKSLSRDGNHYVSFGAQAGFVQQSIDEEKLLFDNQFDGDVLNPNLPSGEQLVFENNNYFDFSAGAVWSYTPERFTSFYAGVSVSHLNRPTTGFLVEDNSLSLYTKMTLFAGAEFRMNYLFSLIPRAVVLKQGPASEYNFGALLKLNMGRVNGYDDMTSLYVGTMHRLGDAQIFIARFDYGPFGVSFSYDVNFSKLNIASQGRGAAELAVVYTGALFQPTQRGRNTVRCPSF